MPASSVAPAPAPPAPRVPELLTPSRMSAFRTCARLHQLRYVERWKPRRTSEPMRFGTLFHLGLEAWWKATGAGVDPFDPMMAAVAGRGIDAFEQAKAEVLLAGYHQRWYLDAAQYEVLGVEVEFQAPLLNPATWAPSRTWRLGGKIDLLLRRRADNRVLVCEHKTSSEAIEDLAGPYWAKLAMDHQISSYVLGAESLGHQVDEVLYDVALRPAQRQLLATPVEKRQYKKDGTLYATQRDRDETPEEFRARIEAAVFEDMVAPAGDGGSTGSGVSTRTRYFQRQSIPRMESQIEDFMFDAWMQGAAMREAARLGRAPRNPDACFRYGACSFWDVCSSRSTPSDFPALYERSESQNPELKQEV